MAELKTQRTDASVEAFLKGIADDQRRADSRTLMKIMKKATGAKPAMWGAGIVGFGSHEYKYASGRTGVWFQVGFAPRKGHVTLYTSTGLEIHASLLAKLGKHSCGKSCLHIKRVSDVDLDALEELVVSSVERLGGKSS